MDHRFLLPRIFDSLFTLPLVGDFDPIAELHSALSTSEGVKLSSPTVSSFRANRNISKMAIKYSYVYTDCTFYPMLGWYWITDMSLQSTFEMTPNWTCIMWAKVSTAEHCRGCMTCKMLYSYRPSVPTGAGNRKINKQVKNAVSPWCTPWKFICTMFSNLFDVSICRSSNCRTVLLLFIQVQWDPF